MSCQMVSNLSKLEEVNVLASGADWAWPEALRHIFKPRGVNLLVAENATEFVNVIRNRRIHTTIVDMDSEHSNGLGYRQDNQDGLSVAAFRAAIGL
jgi:hypothetical protein